MLQPSKGKKKKANGSSSYGQISSSQEQRAESTNTIAKNFLKKAGKVAADMVFEAGGLGVGKRLLGAVKKAADQRKRTSNQGSVEELKSFKRKELPKSVSIRSKESTPSKRQPPRTKPGTERKTQYKKIYTTRPKRFNDTVTNPKRFNDTVTNPGSGLSPVNGNAFTGAKAVTRMNDDGKGKKIKNEVARDTTISGRSMNEGMARKMFNHNFRKFNPGGDVPKANLTQEKNKGGQMQYVYSATVGTSPTEMNSPAAYGTGSPFQLKKEKLSGSERKNKEEGIDTSSNSNKKRFAEYKEKGGKLTTTQAARIGYASPKESKSRESTYAKDYGRENLKN